MTMRRSVAAAAPAFISLLTLSGARTTAAFVPRHVSPYAPCALDRSHFYSTTTSLQSSIVDQVTAEMKTAMKAKDTTTLATVRLIRSAFANAAIEAKTEKLSDEQAQGVLRKMAKMRQESIDMFMDGGAEDRADAERAELAVIERWLPSLADEETTRAWVREAIETTGASDASKMGQVMGALMKAHKAELDGKLAQKIVKEELTK